MPIEKIFPDNTGRVKPHGFTTFLPLTRPDKEASIKERASLSNNLIAIEKSRACTAFEEKERKICDVKWMSQNRKETESKMEIKARKNSRKSITKKLI